MSGGSLQLEALNSNSSAALLVPMYLTGFMDEMSRLTWYLAGFMLDVTVVSRWQFLDSDGDGGICT